MEDKENRDLTNIANQSQEDLFDSWIEKARTFSLQYDYAEAVKWLEKALQVSKNVTWLETETRNVYEQRLADYKSRVASLIRGWYVHSVKARAELPGKFSLPLPIFEKLMPHQQQGVQWLWQLHERAHGQGGCLADDPGLGKTVQISVFLYGLFRGHFIRNVLIVVPTSLRPSWTFHLREWCPDIQIGQYESGAAVKPLQSIQQRGGICITTYGLARSATHSLTQNDRFIWDYVILDEGHFIKNHNTQSAKALRTIAATHRLLLSGTPIQNNLQEIWSLFDYLCQGRLLGSLTSFQTRFVDEIIKGRKKDATDAEKTRGEQLAQQLRDCIAPFVLRREKSRESNETVTSAISSSSSQSVQLGLQRKCELVIWLPLSPAQLALYRAFLHTDDVKQVLNRSKSPLAALTIVRQICDHPKVLQSDTTTTSQLDLTQFWQVNHTLPIHKQLASLSSKLAFLLDLIDQLKGTTHRLLVFCEKVRPLNVIGEALKSMKVNYLQMDGTTEARTRQTLVEQFNKDSSIICMLLTTGVGGVGLTLTGADRVVIFSPSWNPAVDVQAIDRAYRIGQQKSVQVYRLVTCGTVEERVYRLQVFKTALQRITMQSESVTRYFTGDELKEAFKLTQCDVSKTQQTLNPLRELEKGANPSFLEQETLLKQWHPALVGITFHHQLYSEAGERLLRDAGVMEEVPPEQVVDQEYIPLGLSRSLSSVEEALLGLDLNKEPEFPVVDLSSTEAKEKTLEKLMIYRKCSALSQGLDACIIALAQDLNHL